MVSKKLSLLLILAHWAGSSLAWSFNLVEWLKHPPYAKGGTVQEQIQCYALPYGGIGFVSHCLTYFTVILLASGRSPLCPWKRLTRRRLNLIIAGVGVMISFPLTVLTMIRCRNTWPFILIAVWKLVLSLTLTTMTIHAARLIRDYQPIVHQEEEEKEEREEEEKEEREEEEQQRHPDPEAEADTAPLNPPVPSALESAGYTWAKQTPAYVAEMEGLKPEDPSARAERDTIAAAAKEKKRFRNVWWWSLPYFLGAIVGFTGVMNLVKNHIAEVAQLRTVTYAFVGIVGGLMLLVLLFTFCVFKDETSVSSTVFSMGATSFLFLLIFMTVLFALYTDWALAAMAGDLVGNPSSENALFYWMYIAVKRFPMLSM